MRQGIPLLLCACCFVAACPLVAETIVITETTTATGTLYAPIGSTSSPVRFTDAALLLTYTGDASGTVSDPTGSITGGGVVTTSIAGLGMYTNLDVWFADTYSGLGQGDFGEIASSTGNPDGIGDFVLATFGDAFATSDLAHSFGPYTGTTYARGGNIYDPPVISTSGGESLVFDSFGSTTTFQSTVSSTPEPSSLVLLGTGLAGVVGLARRRYLQG